MNAREYLDCRDAMPTCTECGAANSGNITCKACRQTNRVEYQKHGWPTEWIDRIDEVNPTSGKPLGPEDIKPFINRINRLNEGEKDA